MGFKWGGKTRKAESKAPGRTRMFDGDFKLSSEMGDEVRMRPSRDGHHIYVSENLGQIMPIAYDATMFNPSLLPRLEKVIAMVLLNLPFLNPRYMVTAYGFSIFSAQNLNGNRYQIEFRFTLKSRKDIPQMMGRTTLHLYGLSGLSTAFNPEREFHELRSVSVPNFDAEEAYLGFMEAGIYEFQGYLRGFGLLDSEEDDGE